MRGEAPAWRNPWSEFRDKIGGKADRWRVRGKRRVNSLNELLLSGKEMPFLFFFFFSRSYRDLSYKDFLITFHPFFALVTSYWKKSPFSVVLATVLQGAAGGCAVPRPGGSEEMLMIRACTNGLMSKWKVYFQ